MKKENNISKTFNELLLKIFSGVDYVSKIALETHKSIPVVYRQLDFLVKTGLLRKKRSGKQVSYSINWTNLSDIMASILILDIEKVRKFTNATKIEKSMMEEINNLTDDLPNEIFASKNALQIALNDFMNNPSIKEMVQGFFKSLDEPKYAELAFNETLELFFDTFGMMNTKEQKKLAKKFNLEKKEQDILKYCRLHYLHKQINDPRTRFYRDVLR